MSQALISELLKLKAYCTLPEFQDVDYEILARDTNASLFEGASEADVRDAILMAVRSKIEEDPAYSLLAGRLLNQWTNDAVTALGLYTLEETVLYGISAGQLDPLLATFDLAYLNNIVEESRSHSMDMLAVSTLVDRYLQRDGQDQIFETIQRMLMRVAMGLAINEGDNRNQRAVDFYEVLSCKDYMASTPTLFNAGTNHAQLSSCYLTTIPDDLNAIYEAYKENALLSKWAGGLGNDWTPVRAMGSRIKGTNGKSQGVVPFLNVQNASCVAVNQGGKRKGAACAYLETWHADIEEFLELRKNTGDDRRRTHDMNTANWVPDEFMRRVFADEDWYLMSPDEVGDLHDLYGKAFSERYAFYVNEGLEGRLATFRKVRATDLWRKMLSMLFETGHPWITFKDPCNIRSPQQHVGVVHSSNLCTEITLNTSAAETAVCNLGSINLVQHVTEEGQIDYKKLESTVSLAIRMLDNVIDINYYPTDKARDANLAHRPVGLGVMGFQDALYKLGYAYGSNHAIRIASEFQEAIACYAIKASALLVAERGQYASYAISLWDRGIFPQDSAETLMEERHVDYVRPNLPEKDFWKETRALVAKHGMRNSNVMAIAPTATISNICGVSQSIEPTFQNLYVKSNLSGEFTVVNPYLVNALKYEGLWSKEMAQQLKVWDGSVQHIPEIPEYIKEQFKTAFEHDMKHLITINAGRQYWVDQAISLNIYLARPDGKLLDSIYKHAYEVGLKTTYYLRSKGATSTEKATVSDGQLNAVKRTNAPKACSIDNPDCEACQ